jgi:alpha-glucosidase (family GH31 glycosyl hydrolase)
MTYINPFLSDVSLKSRFQKNLFVEAREMGYLVKGIHDEKHLSIKIGLGVEVGLLDLTNPETRAWFKEILKKQVWNSDISGINHFKMR